MQIPFFGTINVYFVSFIEIVNINLIPNIKKILYTKTHLASQSYFNNF